MQILVHLMLPQRSLRLFSFHLVLFSLFCSIAVISPVSFLGHLFFLPHLFCYYSFQCIFHFCYCIVLLCLFFKASVVVVKSITHVQFFVTPWTTSHQPSPSFTISWSLLKLVSLGRLCYITISTPATPFSFCPLSFPASGSFPMSWLFASGSQSIGA